MAMPSEGDIAFALFATVVAAPFWVWFKIKEKLGK